MTTLDDLPPSDPELEDDVIGALLGAPDQLEQVAAILEPEDFTHSWNRNAWRAMLAMAPDLPDLNSLLRFLRQKGDGYLQGCGGEDRLTDLLAKSELYGMAPQFARQLHEVGKWRRLDDTQKSLAAAVKGGKGSPEEVASVHLRLLEAIDRRPQVQPTLEDLPACPPLPDGVQPDPAIGESAGAWLRLYANFAADVSPMTPTLFHESAGLWLGAVAIARRLKLTMHFGDIFSNLFIAWIAPTTLYRKSTALEVARRLARKVVPHLLAAQETTPEAFLADLAGREPPMLETLPERDRAAWALRRNFAAQRGIVLDELSGLMAGAGRDYNAGLVESFLRFYDCDPLYERSTRGQGLVIVRNSSLSLLGASTPAAMLPHLKSERLWAMGFWPRFGLLTPEEERPQWQEPREAREPAELAGWLHDLYNRLPAATWPDAPEARAVALGAGVYPAWLRYNRALAYDLLTDDLDSRLHGSYGRLPVLALKIGLILAALDGWEGRAPIIELPHLSRAIAITEQWRASAHRAIQSAARGEFDRQAQRILKLAARNPAGPTLRELHLAMRDVDAIDLEQTVAQMVRMGLLAEADWQNPRGGPKTKRYPLVLV